MSQAKPQLNSNIVSEPLKKEEVPTDSNTRGAASFLLGISRKWFGGGGDEWRRWRRAFDSPVPFVLLLAALLALVLAWQVPFSYTLDSSGELGLDQPFFRNFNSIEKTAPDGNKPGQYYRWSKGEGSLDFQGIGRRPYRLQMNLTADANPDKRYILYANTLKIAEGQIEPGIKTYIFEVPASAISYKNGNLRLVLKMQGFTPGKDPRELGFVFFSAKLEPVGSDPVVPPLTQLGLLLGVVMLAYLLLARAGFSPWRSAGVAALMTSIPVYVVATPADRIWLTIYSTEVAFAFGWALLMVVLLDIPMRKVWTVGWERRWVLSIFGLGLALRLSGLLHPQALTNQLGGPPVIDLGFHVNRFSALWDRGLWWDKIASQEWGSRLTYYPHTTYAIMGLFQWLIPDRKLLILVWTATLESSRILLIFYLVKRVTNDGRSATIAAFFLAAMPVNLLSLAWGQTANLFAEWLMLVALCITVVKWEQLRKPGYFAILTATLWASFIVHPGAVILSGVVFGAIGGLWWLFRDSRRQAKFFLLAYALAIVLAFASYHWVTVQEMIPQALQSLDSRGKGGAVGNTGQTGFRVGGSVRDQRLGFVVRDDIPTFGEMLVEGAKGFWREARVYYDVIPLLLFPIGLFWLRRRKQKAEIGNQKLEIKDRLFWAGVIWMATGLLFAIVGLLLNLYVRYSLFMLPFVAVGAGLFLGQLWRRQEAAGRGWAAALLTFSIAAWIGLGTATLFFDRMIYLYHGP